MTFEQWAQENGFDLSSLDEANQTALLKIYEAETAEPVDAEGTETDKDKPEAKPVQASAMRNRRVIP